MSKSTQVSFGVCIAARTTDKRLWRRATTLSSSEHVTSRRGRCRPSDTSTTTTRVIAHGGGGGGVKWMKSRHRRRRCGTALAAFGRVRQSVCVVSKATRAPAARRLRDGQTVAEIGTDGRIRRCRRLYQKDLTGTLFVSTITVQHYAITEWHEIVLTDAVALCLRSLFFQSVIGVLKRTREPGTEVYMDGQCWAQSD